MDTDDLSRKTYKAILVEAEKFNSDLTLQFGLLSGECINEKEFIEKSKVLIAEIKRMKQYELDDLFFGNPPSIMNLHVALDKILKNIFLLK